MYLYIALAFTHFICNDTFRENPQTRHNWCVIHWTLPYALRHDTFFICGKFEYRFLL